MLRPKYWLLASAGLLALMMPPAKLNALDGLRDPARDNVVANDDGVQPLFDLDHPKTAPFPSDIYTTADHTQTPDGG